MTACRSPLKAAGHWGAKLSISDDEGATWADAPAQIKYLQRARYIGQDMYEDTSAQFGVGWRISSKPATLAKLWVIGFGAGGRVYVGTIPGGLSAARMSCKLMNSPIQFSAVGPQGYHI